MNASLNQFHDQICRSNDPVLQIKEMHINDQERFTEDHPISLTQQATQFDQTASCSVAAGITAIQAIRING